MPKCFNVHWFVLSWATMGASFKFRMRVGWVCGGPGKKCWSGWRTGIMMTSSNGNMFRVTGHLCGKFTGPRWIPRTKASDADLSLICVWINGWVNDREAGDLRCYRAYYGVIVMWWGGMASSRLVAMRTGFLGAVSIRKTVLPGMAIPMLKIRRPNGRLIFNMEIAIRR